MRANGEESERVDKLTTLVCRYRFSLYLGIVLYLLPACSHSESVAVPVFEIDPVEASIGSPVEVTLTFSVLPKATLETDYLVFLHFLNNDGELMWATDHYPPRPTSRWQPGETIKYTRTLLVPLCPYLGQAQVQVGLYSSGDGTRVILDGDEVGERAYRVGDFRLLPPARNTRFSYRSGWHLLEYDSTCAQWRWSEEVGVMVFDNPRQDARLYLALEHRESVDGEQRRLTVSMGDRIAAQIEIRSGYEVQEIPLARSFFGDADEVAVTLEVDRPFVPTVLPGEESTDDRVLGVRVMGAYLSVG